MFVNVEYCVDSTDNSFERLIEVSKLSDWVLSRFSDNGRRMVITGIYLVDNTEYDPAFLEDLKNKYK